MNDVHDCPCCKCDELPKFGDYQMREELDIDHSSGFYLDKDGDLWIDSDVAICVSKHTIPEIAGAIPGVDL